MAHSFQQCDGVRRNGFFEIQFVGFSLMVETRPIHGVLDIRMKLGDVEKYLQHTVDNPRAASGADSTMGAGGRKAVLRSGYSAAASRRVRQPDVGDGDLRSGERCCLE